MDCRFAFGILDCGLVLHEPGALVLVQFIGNLDRDVGRDRSFVGEFVLLVAEGDWGTLAAVPILIVLVAQGPVEPGIFQLHFFVALDLPLPTVRKRRSRGLGRLRDRAG